jgi:hypothetical protein
MAVFQFTQSYGLPLFWAIVGIRSSPNSRNARVSRTLRETHTLGMRRLSRNGLFWAKSNLALSMLFDQLERV